MVFWLHYPNTIRPCIGDFKITLFEKHRLPSPTGLSAIIVAHNASISLRTEICNYLRTYFGNPPYTPLFVVKEDELLREKDLLFVVRDTEQIVGTLRYRFVGQLLTQCMPDIYRVDAFCIHPSWRKRGVGDYLLTQLHCYANEKGIPYAMFLKEGSSLSIYNSPFYTGQYVFRQLCHTISSNVQIISLDVAHRILDIYHTIYPQVCIIRNRHSPQTWRLYKKGYDFILACFQDTNQQMNDGGKMGWCTAWLESSIITENSRGEAAIEITDSVADMFNYVWIDKKHVGNKSIWKEDGYFHWYTYQWTTTYVVEQSFCIMD
jgi:hypothetical protein